MALPAQEVGRRGVVRLVAPGNESVQVAQPEECGAHQPSGGCGAGEPANQVIDAPEQLRTRPGDRSGIDLVEPPEQVAMAARREADEVVRPGVYLLQERGFGVDEPAVPEHSVDLRDHASGVEHVLQDSLDQNGVGASVGQRDLMGVSDELGVRATDDVEADDLHAWIGVRRGHSVADRPTAYDEQHG